jgi:BirA family transcriptional regulator, biotin operon repressor / biotin---[acetyl-CoA-carboxylase] ligase
MTIDAQILAAMRGGGEEGVSGADLALRLGISRAAVWARIEELRRHGYDITASPHLGYRLLGMTDVLHADDLLSRLEQNRIIGRDIRVFQETTSTSDVVEKLARDGVKEGAVVFAESQTKGRGRMGRRWVSPAGKGLWFSVLLRPQLRPQEATRMTVATAVAVGRAIQLQTGLLTAIKWPNDLLIGGKKVAGILTELAADPDQIKHLIIGIGLDANLTLSDLSADLRPIATSLRIVLDHPVDRPALAARILKELDVEYRRVCRGQFAAVADEWESRCSTLGSRVTVNIGPRLVEGLAESLDDDGALLVRTQHGRIERIIGGDVTLQKPVP